MDLSCFFSYFFMYFPVRTEKSSLVLRPANSHTIHKPEGHEQARTGVYDPVVVLILGQIDHTSETQDESLDQDEDEIIVCCPRRGARSRLRRFKRGREDQARALQAVSGPVGRKPVVAF